MAVDLGAAVERAMPYSKCGRLRLENTWASLKHVDEHDVPGDFVECGVWRGGQIMIARWASPLRRCWLFDTFDGMTEPGPFDGKRGVKLEPKKDGRKWAACDVHEVRANLQSVGLYDPGFFRFVIGDVRETLLRDDLPEKIAVLRLDTDLYDSTKIELEVLYPRLVSGGVLIIDDFNHWDGARKAAIDYLGKGNKLQPIDYTGAWMVKP